jgi:hypothetical protein
MNILQQNHIPILIIIYIFIQPIATYLNSHPKFYTNLLKNKTFQTKLKSYTFPSK